MAEFTEDTDIWPVLTALAECATAQLVKDGLEPITHVSIQPGNTGVLDYVGMPTGFCGEIVININQGYPVAPFPNQAAGATCASEMAYEVQLGIFRCAPQPKGSKQAMKMPTSAEQVNAARVAMADMSSMRRAIACCMQKTGRQYNLRAFQSYGPQGNVVGGNWTVIVGAAW